MQTYRTSDSDRRINRMVRIAEREIPARAAMEARRAEIATFAQQRESQSRQNRTADRLNKLSSMLEFAEVFGVEIQNSSDETPGIGSCHVPTTTHRLGRLARLERISARIGRREAREHAKACYGAPLTNGLILSHRGVRIADAILQATGGSRTSIEFGNTVDTRHLDRLKTIKRIHASRNA